jgi:hypothetical protein
MTLPHLLVLTFAMLGPASTRDTVDLLPNADTRPTLAPFPDVSRPTRRVVARAQLQHREPLNWERRKAGFPEGVRVITATTRLGDQRLNAVSIMPPQGTKPDARWSHVGIALANGTVRHGQGLASWWRQGNGGWGHWGFVRVMGRVGKGNRTEALFPPGVVTHADAYVGQTHSSVDFHFERQWPTGQRLGLTLRFVRYPDDPYVYGICRLEAEGVTCTHLGLSGYPNTTHAPGFSGRRERGYTRCAVLEGVDGSVVKGRAEPVREKGWTFLYTRGALQEAGMTAVYLPEEVSGIRAAGGYGVMLGLALRRPAGCRFALNEWRHRSGWEPELKRLTGGEAQRVQERLRSTRFAWPDAVLVPAPRERSAMARLAGSGLPIELKGPITAALTELEAASAALPTADAQTRFTAERRVRVAAKRLRQARDAALGHWIEHVAGK